MLAVLPAVVFAERPARAEHAVIRLQVLAPNGEQHSSADQEPPLGGNKPRPRMTVKRGDPLVLEFFLTNSYPHKSLSDVVVKYYVVPTTAFGAKEVPDLKTGAVAEGTVNMNFKPKCRVGARLNFRLDRPGYYLVRVETQNTQSDHEHFSAIDVEVQ